MTCEDDEWWVYKEQERGGTGSFEGRPTVPEFTWRG